MERAAWVPGWYQLDQTIAVGLTREFLFWRVVPDGLRGPERLVFYNRLPELHPEEVLVARGTVAAISHPELGEIREIDNGLDTGDLDYTIHLADGTTLTLLSEEDAGTLYEPTAEPWPFSSKKSSRQVTDWRCVVDFESLSELRPAEPP